MTCAALIPLKTLGLGKTRLSPDLCSGHRKHLVETMLGAVIKALTESARLDQIAIVGMDPLQCPAHVLHLPDPGQGLNAALAFGRHQLRRLGAVELLMIHADLPLVTGKDIDAFISAGRQRGIAMAGDRHGSGTNALFLQARSDFRFCFGENSLTKHLQQADICGLQPALSRSPGLMIDIDTPQDLSLLLGANNNTFEPSLMRMLSHA